MRFTKIIFEGPNNVGKSTLIKEIRKLIKYEVEHITEKCPNDYEFYKDLLSDEEPMIFDRMLIGEMVYPFIYNREPKLSMDDFLSLARKFDESTLVIFVDADYDFIIRSCESKNETFKYDEVKEERQKFYKLWQIYTKNCDHVMRVKNHWDLSVKSEIVNKILEAIVYDGIL